MLFTIEDYYIGESDKPVVIKFEFTPEQRAVLYSDYAQPHEPAEIEIYSVVDGNIDEIFEMMTTYEHAAMEEACFDEVEKHFEAIQCGKDDAAEAREDERRGR